MAGELISYTIRVTNTGNQTLTGVTLTDPFVTDLTRVADVVGDDDDRLEVGETWAWTASHAVTQAEIDAGSDIVNTATVDSTQTTPDTDDAAIPVTQAPALAIAKSGTFDAGADGLADPGELISYTFGVSNTGNVTLTGVTVSDPLTGLSAISCPATTLAVGGSMTCSATYPVTRADIDAGSVHNTATADSTESGPDEDSHDEPLAQAPALAIAKDASVPGGTANVAGELISYTIRVTNTGNQTLTGVTLTDPFVTDLTRVADVVGDDDDRLEVGETWPWTASHAVTQAEIDAGSDIVNTATVDSTQTTPDTDDTAIPVTQAPALAITKDASVPGGTANVAGELISYTIRVTNTGNQTLTGVTLTDPFVTDLTRVADVVGDDDDRLEVGETWAWTASHAVTQAEIDAGSDIVNTATVDSTQTTPNTDDAAIPVTQAPALAIAKSGTFDAGADGLADPGELISYTFGVSNTGNVTLTGVTVSDPLTGLSAISCPATTLAVGGSMTCSATYPVTRADIDAGSVHNTATADSTESGPDEDSHDEPLAQAPALAIAKDASVPGGTANVAGELISYTIRVTTPATRRSRASR